MPGLSLSLGLGLTQRSGGTPAPAPAPAPKPAAPAPAKAPPKKGDDEDDKDEPDAKPDAKPEEWQAFYKKIGSVPEDPTGYKIPADIAPEIASQLADDPMMKAFREHAHTIGMPPMFFESAVKWYIDQSAGGEEAMIADFTKKSEADLMSLKTEWPGVEYDKNVELGRRAAREFLPHENDDEFTEKMSRIEGALGTKETMKLWAAIGGSIGEAGFVSGEGNGNVNGGMSPEAARVRIDSLKKDPAFAAKLLNNDADARAEWDRLHKTAYTDK